MNAELKLPQKLKARQWIILAAVAGTVFAALLYTMFDHPNRRLAQASGNQQVYERSFRTPASAVDPQRAWISASEVELQQLREEIKALKELRAGENARVAGSSSVDTAQLTREVSELRGMFDAMLRNQASVQRPQTAVPGPSPTTAAPARGGGADVGPAILGSPAGPGAAPAGSPASGNAAGGAILGITQQKAAPKIVTVSFDSGTRASLNHIRDTIPSGSFGRAALLTGLDAPTGGKAKSDPIPVLLEVIDLANLPNRYRHQTRECRVVAAGIGNLSDERAYLRLERLSCVLRNGEIISQRVKGWVSGPDGKVGIHGELREKQGALLARSFLAGMFSGLGSGLAQSYTDIATSAQGAVQSVDTSRILEYGVATGVGNSLEKIAEWYLERANDVFPVISVNGGVIVEINFEEDVPLGANLLARYTAPGEQ